MRTDKGSDSIDFDHLVDWTGTTAPMIPMSESISSSAFAFTSFNMLKKDIGFFFSILSNDGSTPIIEK